MVTTEVEVGAAVEVVTTVEVGVEVVMITVVEAAEVVAEVVVMIRAVVDAAWDPRARSRITMAITRENTRPKVAVATRADMVREGVSWGTGKEGGCHVRLRWVGFSFSCRLENKNNLLCFYGVLLNKAYI